ncbi:hypothetical protein CLHUN_17640 [Ruminiclostridium hungatei]|uniref:Uncharacterized protein n=1 Tax=Ruminiclostridium hungatei TaxID=48256 RepID=A0A1V4SK13_RUMHU|nr:DUF6756 family protein [Ruminiclostridium hungatei]OPX44210.1 hypothetical protein CLHUN_17640 [Ruminiclostridium hungatei]
MWNIKGQIKSAAGSLNVNIQEVQVSDIDNIVSQAIDKFAGGNKVIPFWENLIDYISINNKDAWLWIGELIGDTETIMFFNTSDEKAAFAFNNGDNVVSVLSETYGFEFYLTNRATEYLLCFNHHDVLIACGNAIKWLKKYKTPENDAFLRT